MGLDAEEGQNPQAHPKCYEGFRPRLDSLKWEPKKAGGMLGLRKQYATITSLQRGEPAENCLFSRPALGFYQILFKACFVFWLTGSFGLTPSQHHKPLIHPPSLFAIRPCVHFYTNFYMNWTEISYYGILFNKITYICMIVSRIVLCSLLNNLTFHLQ